MKFDGGDNKSGNGPTEIAKARLFITHLLLLLFIAAIMFPLLMVVAISLRQGTATGSLIPSKSPGITGNWR